MAYIYSTLTGDQEYAVYPPPDQIDFKRIPKPIRTILVYGGANVINKNFLTLRGVATHVTEEDLKALEQVKAFQRHRDRGFITVEKTRQDPEKVAQAGMASRDSSAQLEDKDFADNKKPKLAADDG